MVPSAAMYDPAVHLSYGDVMTDNIATPKYIEVVIKSSKTDPFRKGVTIYLEQRGRPCAQWRRYYVTW